jgi:hypothetical protein
MARQTGDLWPHASGTASLGVDQINGPQGGFANEIRPFNHIHQNSGVWHHGGMSGLLRFHASSTPGFEMSFDGGGSFPLLFHRLASDASRIQVTAGNSLYIDGDELILTGDAGAIFLTGTCQFVATNGLIQTIGDLYTMTCDSAAFTAEGGSYHVRSLDHMVKLDSFDGSGILQYGFGPYEGWQVAVGAGNTDLVPIPHSGHIVQMIAEGGGGGVSDLQGAYDGGSTITTAGGNPVAITGDGGYGLSLQQTENEYPHVDLTGLVQGLSSTPAGGDFWLQAHTAGVQGQLCPATSYPTTAAEAAAMSLGPETLFYHAGSGIVAIRPASGVAQYFNALPSDAIDETGVTVPVGFATTGDRYSITKTAAASDGITIQVAGMYRVQYTAVLEKTAGNLAQQVDTQLQVDNAAGTSYELYGSNSSALVRNSTTLNKNTANGMWTGDFQKGDRVRLYATHNGVPPAGNTVIASQRSSTIIVEWLAPIGAGSLTRIAL